jgi:UDP-N-acetylglucosamine 2-epimerase
MKVVSIAGARPQFIKMAMLDKKLKNQPGIRHIIVHTGQHYDKNMSRDFFDELDIPEPAYNLGVVSDTHSKQTAMMMERIEKVLAEEKPEWVLVYGDTNSTLAGVLTAAKMQIKTAHIEAGLRSYNRKMPEEINRIIADHISDMLFVPTANAMEILKNEGLEKKSHLVGDVMYDSVLFYIESAEKKYRLSDIVPYNEYYLATIHRQENTDNIDNLVRIFNAFGLMGLPVVIPLHPRTRKYLKDINIHDNVKVIDPSGYLKMLMLIKNAVKVLTDSGGIQKEAYFLRRPCITLRNETEWTETLENGWNYIVGTDAGLILEKVKDTAAGPQKAYFGDGNAAGKIAEIILDDKTV